MEKYKNLDKIGDGTYGTVLKSVNKDMSKIIFLIFSTKIKKINLSQLKRWKNNTQNGKNVPPWEK